MKRDVFMREGEGFFWKERRFQERKAGIEMPNGKREWAVWEQPGRLNLLGIADLAGTRAT